MTDYDILISSLVLVGCLADRKRTINRRVQKRLDITGVDKGAGGPAPPQCPGKKEFFVKIEGLSSFT